PCQPESEAIRWQCRRWAHHASPRLCAEPSLSSARRAAHRVDESDWVDPESETPRLGQDRLARRLRECGVQPPAAQYPDRGARLTGGPPRCSRSPPSGMSGTARRPLLSPPTHDRAGTRANCAFFSKLLVQCELELQRDEDGDRFARAVGGGSEDPLARGLDGLLVESVDAVEGTCHPNVTHRAVGADDGFEPDNPGNLG